MQFVTKSIFAVMLLTGLIALPALAQTIYVNQKRCVEGDGSWANPYRTLSTAVEKAPNGSTIVIQSGKYPEKDRLPLLIGKSGKRLTLKVANGTVEVGRVYTERLEQLTGETDPIHKPHHNNTRAWSAPGIDLGANTEHNGRVYIFFGDVWQAADVSYPRKDDDLIAYFDKTQDPEKGLYLTPVLRADKTFYPFNFTRPDPSDPQKTLVITPGRNETPTGAFSFDGKVYVFVVTGFIDETRSDTISHLTVSESDDPSQPTSFRHVFELSRWDEALLGGGRFYQVAPYVIKNAQIAGLPPEAYNVPDGLLMFGHGGHSVSLAWMPLREGLPPNKAEIRYYKGNNTWTALEGDAQPLFPTSWPWTSLSVGRINETGKWVLLYQRTWKDKPERPQATDECIVARFGNTPWELSGEVEIFNPYREDAIGQYLYQKSCPDQPSHLYDEFGPGEDGFVYGAYLLNPYTKWDPVNNAVTIYYLMSTSSPYQVQLMRSRIRLGK